MVTFVISLIALLLGYLFYGTLVEKVFRPDDNRPAPCFSKADGVDFMPLPAWKVYLIQFLNIAGTGPIFGAIMGILFGPAAYLWIVFGSIFAGAVHDYLCGMVSMRQGGATLPEIAGHELGRGALVFSRVFTIVLLVLVSAVFVVTPASLLCTFTPGWGFLATPMGWCVVIFVYYILATVLPINQLIGRIYPIFGLALLVMAVGIGICLFTHEGWMPELTDGLTGHHPKHIPVFPMLCITIACGAISGFHATQSPLMARCLQRERLGRRIFYGSMITEGVVALVWAAAAIKFAGSYESLAAMGNPSVVVNNVCTTWMGSIGAVLAILGVVAAPISSGDTALRSARLTAAEMMHFDQHRLWRRLSVSLPLFALCALLMCIDFSVLWRYFAWCNQTLACLTLWAVTVWLVRHRRCFWIAFLPAVFMTLVVTSYILVAPEGFSLPQMPSVLAGVVAALLSVCIFWRWHRRYVKAHCED